MKKYVTYAFVAMGFLLGACNNEFNEEVYTHVVGLKAVMNSEGTTNVYMRYEPDGKTIYNLPVIIGGSTANEENLNIRISVDPDTLASMNEERYKLREDLYYKLLPEEFYRFVNPAEESTSGYATGLCLIPSGQSVGLFDIEFNFTGLDLRYKWVLPLTVEEDAGHTYLPNYRKHYRKAFLRVMPFNDYSGTYGATTMNVSIEGTDPTTVSSRTFYVVDETTCFFYAGVVSEDYIEREKYKVNVKFNPDGTLTVTPADPNNEMNFAAGECTYTTSSQEDATDANIVHEYTTLNMTYSYNNFTDHIDKNGEPILINYSASGNYTMERRINTLIPDRDQAIQW